MNPHQQTWLDRACDWIDRQDPTNLICGTIASIGVFAFLCLLILTP